MRIIISLFVVLLGLTSCDPNAMHMPDSYKNMEFPAAGGTQTATFETGYSWHTYIRMSSDDEEPWASITPETGEGDGQVTIVVQENTTGKERKCEAFVLTPLGSQYACINIRQLP